MEVAQADAPTPAVPQKRPAEIASPFQLKIRSTRRIATAHVVSAVDEKREGGSTTITAIEKKLRELSRNRLPCPRPHLLPGRSIRS